VLKNLLLSSLLFLSAAVTATYVYESGQPLYDLQTNSSGSTGLGSNDDAVSGAFNIGFTFDFYGQSFTQARMATNGCLHFKTSGAYCNDYTPDPLPEVTYTLYPFWTDLIKDNGSGMRAKVFDDYTIFGWYNMREYNRANSDNSFEVWLYPNDTFEFRYGALDIINHDVLIGEQGSATETYTYLFHDECSTGTTNVAGTCVNTDWNGTASNTALENGGSLYGVGSGNALDCSNVLNDSSCVGYAAAYLTQQCDIDSLYSNSCTGYAAAYLTQQCDIDDLYSQSCTNYWDAYDDQQCDEDSQYSPSCQGYQQEESVAYYADNTDYGFNEEDMWYDEEYDEWLDPNDPCYENRCEGFTDADWYALDIEQFGQEQVDEWYGNEVEFSNEGYIDYGSTSEEEYWTAIDDGMNEYDEEIWQQEELLMVQEEQEIWHEEEIAYEELPFIEEEIYLAEIRDIEEPVEYLEETIDLEVFAETRDLELNIFDADELTELYEFDTIIREELEYEEETIVFVEEMEEREEEMEELQEEDEFMELEEAEERFAEIEEETEGNQESKKSSVRVSALSVVAATLQTARESVVESEVSTSESVEVSVSNYTSNEIFSGNFNTESTGSSAVVNFNNPSSTGSVISFSGGTNYGSTTSASTASVSSSSVISSSSTGGGGISTSSSPSRSDQFASSTAQTQQVLSMSSVAVTDTAGSSSSIGSSSSSVSINIAPMPTVDNSPQVVMAEVQVTNMNNQIDTAVSGVMTASEADQVADKIIAQNIETQQEQAEEELQETGEYADQSTLVAYLGYVPGFNSYRDAQIPNQDSWYTPRSIYADTNIPDNTGAFYSLAGTSLNRLKEMIDLQPTL
jgi:hypothetical protein